ncbi:MAG: histidine phosphatase family protein [Dehalococcoidia bacterium]
MKLILIRHGETYWNKEKRVQGAESDIGLNDTGLEQARKLGTFLKDENIVAILSSPMLRAIATAEAIASHHRLPVEVDAGLIEIRIGELEGMSVSNLSTTFSQFLVQWWRDGRARKSPDGETLVELQQRAWNVVERLLEKHRLVVADPGPGREPAVVIVSHYFVTLAIILKALDLPVDCFTKFKVDTGGVSILEIRDHGPRLLAFNDISYQF